MPTITLRHESEALKDNPVGDPHTRKFHLIVPEGLDPKTPVPCLWYLAGYAGTGGGMLTHDLWQEGLEERLLRLQQEGRLGPMIVALPDVFTKLGGCQYLSSPAVGDYETYLLSELREVVEARYAISAHGIAGKSSGGYGAIVHAMRHPNLFSAAACHSGDMGFELSLFADIPRLMDAVRDHGGVEGLLATFDRSKKKKSGRWFGPLSVLALAAVYSPDASAPLGIGLPFDIEEGTLKNAVLEEWLKWDPVHMIDRPECQDALRQMTLVYVDCGNRDEHALHWGALQFHRKLDRHGIPHLYETFDDGHRATGYRLDESLPRLYAALTGS